VVLAVLGAGLLCACSTETEEVSPSSTGTPSVGEDSSSLAGTPSPEAVSPSGTAIRSTGGDSSSLEGIQSIGEDDSSLAGTQWNGEDSDGYRYEFHFDYGGEVVTRELEYDQWTYSQDGVVFSWSQNGDQVTLTTSVFDVPGESICGTIVGDTLVFFDEGESPYRLELTRVPSGDSGIAGSAWEGLWLVPDGSLEAWDFTYYFDPDGSFRYRTIDSGYIYWNFSGADRTQTWAVSGDSVIMTIVLTKSDFKDTRGGTIDGNRMTLTGSNGSADSALVLTRVE